MRVRNQRLPGAFTVEGVSSLPIVNQGDTEVAARRVLEPLEDLVCMILTNRSYGQECRWKQATVANIT